MNCPINVGTLFVRVTLLGIKILYESNGKWWFWKFYLTTDSSFKHEKKTFKKGLE
jgi:hypothetical protein